MCVYSMIMDHYQERWKKSWPLPFNPDTAPTVPVVPLPYEEPPRAKPISPEEIAEFRRLLERAKKYDAENGEKDCEIEEKKETLRKLAQQLGVEIDFP